jgi:hypothetical protein
LSMHPKATVPSKGFVLKDPQIILLYLAHSTLLLLYIFLICRFKINHVKEL